MASESDSLLEVWFGDDLDIRETVVARVRTWFEGGAAFDEALKRRFGSLPDRALRGEFAAWRETPRQTVALVLALDQLPRNLFRDTGRAFAYDTAAVDTTRWAISHEMDEQVHPVEAAFFYFPLEHAEDIDLQTQCVSLFRRLTDRAPSSLRDVFESFESFAERHRGVIERFGRFPHRNELLGRVSTPEESRYLREGGETFGGSEAEK